MVEEKKTKTKVKRKKWVNILAPALFRNEPIGETPVIEPKSLVGRIVTVNMMSLTRDMKKQNTRIKFVISNVKGDMANTDYYGYYLNQTSIKRLVRRGKEKIGVIVICKTADNKKIRIMPLIIPYSKVKGSVATAFRANATNYLISYAAKTTFENMIRDMVTNKLQRDMKGALKKVYPVRILEIAKLHIESEKKAVEQKVEVGVKEETEEEEKPKEENAVEKKEEKAPQKKEEPQEKEEGVEEKSKEEVKEAPNEEKSEDKPKEEAPKKVEEKKEEVKEEAPKEEPVKK